MKATLTVLTGISVWVAAAIAATVYIHPLLGKTILAGLVVYMIGALNSVWTFFGYPASIGVIHR